jgi:hypothetical protein
MVATFLQMGRSAHLARWLQQARQRSLEKRVRAATDMKEIVSLQRRLDAQQSQAAVVEQASARFRNRATELAQFAKAGLTMEDFHRMGVQHVVDMEKFNAEVAKVQHEMAVPTSPPSSPPAGTEPQPPARVLRRAMRPASGPPPRPREGAAAPAATAPVTTAAPAPAAKKTPAPAPAPTRAKTKRAAAAAAPGSPPAAPSRAHAAAAAAPKAGTAETGHKKKKSSKKKTPRHKG